MPTAAVTGGAGFVGSNLVRELISRGYDVVVLDDLSTGLKSNLNGLNCEFIESSLIDHGNYKSRLEECNFIFHLAARGSVPRSIQNPDATFKVNVEGTLRVLNIAREKSIPFIFSSSSSIYGKNTSLPKSEKMWASPLTPYAASKLSAEALTQSYGYSFKFPVSIYRFFNIYGPWQRPNHDYAAVIPKWIWRAMQGQKIEVFGDGNQTRDFTYVTSVTDCLIAGIETSQFSEEPVNLAFGNRISLNQVLGEIKTYFPNLIIDYLAPRFGDVQDSQNDPKQLRSLFPDYSELDFKEGLKKTIEWFEQTGSQYYSVDASGS